MGLSVTLNNALSGMRVGQKALDVISTNVANAGTPGYHRRSISVIDTLGVNSSYAREGALSRAFNQSLQQHYTKAVAESGFSSVRATYLDRLQAFFGKPGTLGSVDTAFNDFQTALAKAATGSDNYANRADVVQKAQTLAGTLNRLTKDIQSLRQEIETRIGNNVDVLNTQIEALERINNRLADQGIDLGSRATLIDQRDRIVESLSRQLDLRVDYRSDDTVGLMTRSGIGILDVRRSVLSFESSGALSATSRFNPDSSLSSVGKLKLLTPAGLEIDLVQQGILQSGELAGLIELRDKNLVQAQDQLDEIAAGLAKAMSTSTAVGTAVPPLPPGGYEVDIAGLQRGDEFNFKYLQNGAQKTVRVVNVAGGALDYVDANGARVIGIDFAAGETAVASQLQAKLGSGLVVSNPSGSMLRIMDDGAAGTTDMLSLAAQRTVSGKTAGDLQNGDTALALFVDYDDASFTNALEGTGQKLGFAGRIRVNSNILADNRLLVQYTATTSIGDTARLDQIADNLNGMRFAGGLGGGASNASYRLAGTVSDLISQTLNYQGNAAANAISDSDTQTLTLDALAQRLDAEYGVDVDEEMARLMELQNAFAANARVLSVVQELMDQLMRL